MLREEHSLDRRLLPSNGLGRFACPQFDLPSARTCSLIRPAWLRRREWRSAAVSHVASNVHHKGLMDVDDH